ncbi:MAG: cation:proton antiporter [Clostridia bacterium]|jgi:Kef-type K+ transport system membrane component KefB|nr:cation:proton antiporter [Clostridia bacterium]
MEINFLLDLAIILFFAKSFGIISEKFHVPQVIGALIAGIFLGPSITNILSISDLIKILAEIGIIVLMFEAGLETDFKKFEENGKKYVNIATVGVLIPLLFGGAVAHLFINTNFAESFFVGLLLTSTSVSVTVETLNELGRLKSKTGNLILGSIVLDDIFGMLLLSLTLSVLSGNSGNLMFEIIKLIMFFVCAVIFGFAFHKGFQMFEEHEGRKKRIPVFALVFCFVVAYLADKFGVSDIVGAYMAGLVIANTKQVKYIESQVKVLSYLFFTPIFFASIGLKTHLGNIDEKYFVFTIVFVLIAIISKFIAGYIVAKKYSFKGKDAAKIGMGLVPRGEVALIVLDKGIKLNYVSSMLFTPVIILLIVSSLVTPIVLKNLYKKSNV